MRNRAAAVIAALSLAAGCRDSAPAPEDRVTTLFREGFQRPIVDAAGAPIGTVTGKHNDAGLLILVEVHDLPAGEHGMHLHEVGRCEERG